MKLISTTALLLATLLTFTGCDQDTDDACVYGVQLDLDKGNYDSVVSELENNGSCNGAMSMTDSWLNLGAAYNGKAGLTVSKLIGAVMGSDGTDPLVGFMTSFAASASAEGLASLEKAKVVYSYIDNSCDGNETGVAGEACLFDGLTSLTQAVGSLNAVLGADGIALISSTVITGSADDLNGNGTADLLEITACAITDAIAFAGCANVDAVTLAGAPTGTIFVGDDNNYTVREYNVSTTIEYRLINTDLGSVVTTDGFADTNGVACTSVDVDCFPNPARNLDGTTTTVTTGLLDVINNGGLDSLDGLLPAQDDGTNATVTDDLIGSIDGLGGGAVDGTITEDELAAYLLTI